MIIIPNSTHHIVKSLGTPDNLATGTNLDRIPAPTHTSTPRQAGVYHTEHKQEQRPSELRAALAARKNADLATRLIRIDGVLCEVPPPTIPTSLATTALISEATGHTSTQYCRVTGIQLGQCITLFPVAEPTTTLGLHPLFSQSWTTLGKIDQLNPRKTHQQATAMALAYILHRDTFGSIAAIRHPLKFTESQLRTGYHKMLMLARTFYKLAPTVRTKLLADLPMFDTRRLITQDTKSRHGLDYLESLARLPEYFLNWVDTLAEELQLHLEVFFALDLEAEAQELATQLELEHGRDARQARLKANLNDYWHFILSDIQDKFGLPTQYTKLLAQQVRDRTNPILLGELHKYLVGLSNYSRGTGFTGLVPAIQYTNAATTVQEWLDYLDATRLDVELLTPSKPAPTNVLEATDIVLESPSLIEVPTLPVSDQVHDLVGTEQVPDSTSQPVQPATPATPSLTPFAQRMAALAARAAALEADTQEQAASRVASLFTLGSA